MNRVKELRDRAGMQQKELAVAIGVARPTVSEWEHGKKDPSGERLERMERLFGVSRAVILENTVHAPLTTLHPISFSDQPLKVLHNTFFTYKMTKTY